MKTLPALLVIIISLLLPYCLEAQEMKVPLERTFYGPGDQKTLLVLLPGKGERMGVFERKGFIDIFRQSGPAADILAVDATYGYYENGTVLDRLHEDIILPARQKGYDTIALLGISMGGTAALLYDRQYPGSADIIIAFSPYLGDDKLISEIIDAGGLAAWEHIKIRNGKNTLASTHLRDFFGWLKSPAPEVIDGRIYLCYGNKDQFATAHSILEGSLPEDQTLVIKGGHNWKTWKKLLRQLLAGGEFRNQLEKIRN